MSIIASCDLKKGDELTIAFVDVNQYPTSFVFFISITTRRPVGCRRPMFAKKA